MLYLDKIRFWALEAFCVNNVHVVSTNIKEISPCRTHNIALHVGECIHRKKKVRKFPVPSRDFTTKLSMGGNNDVIIELFLPRGSLVSDIPAGEGKLVNLFLRCVLYLDSDTDHARVQPDVLRWDSISPFYCQYMYFYLWPQFGCVNIPHWLEKERKNRNI
jgi:hypothetical protein